MRVVIVGAGLAGLACAHELERLGVAAEIHEQRPQVGRRQPLVEAIMRFMHTDPGRDTFDYLRRDLHLPVQPANHVTRAVLHGARRRAEVSGVLGYTTIRGEDDRSLERQLARHVRAPIRFGSSPDVMDLSLRCDWVVVATGSPDWTRSLGQWSRDLGWWFHGAVVEGDFDPGTVHFFYETRFAGAGFAVLTPFDERRALAGVGIPDASAEQAAAGWQRLRAAYGHLWDRELLPLRLDHYEMGSVRWRRVGNVLLVGNAGGFIEPLGINGQCPALTSGVLAARHIALGDPAFRRYCRDWDRLYRRLRCVRRQVSAWSDRARDRLLGLVDNGVGSLLVRSPWNLLRPAGLVLGLTAAPPPVAPPGPVAAETTGTVAETTGTAAAEAAGISAAETPGPV